MKVEQDGRGFGDLAIATGEGANIEVAPDHTRPPRNVPEASLDTYYEQPLLKEPVWIWTIPVYFFVGGTAGAAAMLAATAEVMAPKRLARLGKVAHWVALAGDSLSAVLLISDLGRPKRFLNMLRVFRPTSPMSIGSWVLSASGASALGALLFGGRWFGTVSGLLGAPLAGYTAVLLTNTAVPAWAGARHTLPVLFLASSATSAGCLLGLLPLDRRSEAVARRFGAMGKLAELAAGVAVRAELGPRNARALTTGFAGACHRFGRAATLASLFLSLGRKRGTRRLGDVAGLAGALALRFAVFQAGKASVRDPRAVREL